MSRLIQVKALGIVGLVGFYSKSVKHGSLSQFQDIFQILRFGGFMNFSRLEIVKDLRC